MMSGTRKHRAILFTDIVGYSSLAYKNEAVAFKILSDNNKIVRDQIAHFNGCERKQTGDGFFVDFASALDATKCAIEIQRAIRERNADLPINQQFLNRIAIHCGEVTELDGDAFGHDVNIAARSQSFAPPGGVALTRIALRSVRDAMRIKYTSIGHKKFKNIPRSMELLSLEMPWERESGEIRKGLFANFEMFKELISSDMPKVRKLNIVDFCLIFGALTIIGAIFFAGYRFNSNNYASGARLSMKDGWKYYVPKSGENLAQVLKNDELWTPIDITKTWPSLDKLHGDYWLKKDFEIEVDQVPESPALLLGLVSKSHRTFINGQFVGGSDKFSELVSYSFDPSLLRAQGINTILIRAFSNKTVDPGIKYLPSIGSFIADFRVTRAAIRANTFQFHVRRYVQLVMAILFMLTCAFYYLFYRHKKQFRYFSVYFLMGALLALYYTPMFSDNLPYQIHRSIKVVSLSLSGFVLFSSYLYLIGRPRLERLNNLLAVFSLGLILSMLLTQNGTVDSYVQRYDLVLQICGYLTLAMSCFMLFNVIRESRQVASGQRIYTYESVYAGTCFVACLFLFVFTFSATRDGFIFEVSRALRGSLRDFSSFFPMVLSPVLVIITTLEHALENLKFRRSHKRSQLLLEIGREFRESRDTNLIIKSTLDKICKFIGAGRATVYTRDRGGEGRLTARCKFGEKERTKLVQYEISEADGVIGYVLKNRKPVVIDDIGTDPRFKGSYENRSDAHYETGACIIIPLIYLGDLIGVITVADKKNGLTFSTSDVSLMLAIGKDLSIIFGNSTGSDTIDQLSMKMSG